MPKGAMTAKVASNFSDVCQRSNIGRQPSVSRRGPKAVVCLAVAMAAGCGSSAIPNPKAGLRDFATAVAAKDAVAVHGMLDEESRRALTVAQVDEILQRDAAELLQRNQATLAADANVEAQVTLSSGEQAAVVERAGAFYLSEPGINGAAALTPVDAVVALRRALEAQSYAALMRVLTPELREQVEHHRKQLIEALRYEDALKLTTDGDRVVVDTADGHRVILEQESGVWRVRDFN